MFDHRSGYSDKGLSLSFSYGLNYYLSSSFSIKTGLGIRQETVNAFSSDDGGDDDSFTFMDIPVTAQYHNNGWTLGLGPVFSLCAANDTYYNDANPNDPLDGKDKLKTFSLGLQPSISYQLSRHFDIGLSADINLTNMQKSYPMISGSQHIHNVQATVGYRF